MKAPKSERTLVAWGNVCGLSLNERNFKHSKIQIIELSKQRGKGTEERELLNFQTGVPWLLTIHRKDNPARLYPTKSKKKKKKKKKRRAKPWNKTTKYICCVLSKVTTVGWKYRLINSILFPYKCRKSNIHSHDTSSLCN